VRHQTILTASIGSIVVAIWTVLRHITNGINFDVIGQVGVTEQWIHGLHDGAVFGSTNYLLKMPLYALVNSVGWLSPVQRLLVLALICSVGAYLLIYLVLRKIARLYGVKNLALLNLGMLWLATIAGRVFWVDYANSRNLEVAGGLAVLYLMLWILERGATWRRLLGLITTSGVVFFADPLQLYIIGGGMGIVAIATAVRNREHRTRALWLGVSIVVGAGLSRVFTWVSTSLLPVSYLAPPKTTFTLRLDTLTTLVHNVLTSTLRIFDINVFTKAFSVNSFRQLGGILLLGLAVYLLVRYRKSAPERPSRILLWLIVWNYVVYTASGNAQIAMTERYLVLVPLFVITLLGIYGDLPKATVLRKLTPLWLATVAMSSLLLFGGLILQWPNRYSLDRPMFALADFAKAHQHDFIVTSQVLAIPANYYAGYETTIVPTVCTSNDRIETKNLFYDRAAYNGKLGQTNGSVGVIIPADGITSGAFRCSTETILKQLGAPKSSETIPNVGTIYEYSAGSIGIRSL